MTTHTLAPVDRTFIVVDVDGVPAPGICVYTSAEEAIRAANAWPEAYRVIQRETTRLVIWVATEPDWTA